MNMSKKSVATLMVVALAVVFLSGMAFIGHTSLYAQDENVINEDTASNQEIVKEDTDASSSTVVSHGYPVLIDPTLEELNSNNIFEWKLEIKHFVDKIKMVDYVSQDILDNDYSHLKQDFSSENIHKWLQFLYLGSTLMLARIDDENDKSEPYGLEVFDEEVYKRLLAQSIKLICYFKRVDELTKNLNELQEFKNSKELKNLLFSSLVSLKLVALDLEELQIAKVRKSEYYSNHTIETLINDLTEFNTLLSVFIADIYISLYEVTSEAEVYILDNIYKPNEEKLDRIRKDANEVFDSNPVGTMLGF